MTPGVTFTQSESTLHEWGYFDTSMFTHAVASGLLVVPASSAPIELPAVHVPSMHSGGAPTPQKQVPGSMPRLLVLPERARVDERTAAAALAGAHLAGRHRDAVGGLLAGAVVRREIDVHAAGRIPGSATAVGADPSRLARTGQKDRGGQDPREARTHGGREYNMRARSPGLREAQIRGCR